MTYGFFADPGCTSPLFAGVTIIDGQLSADRVIYLGTANVNAGVLRAASAPGLDPILVSVLDEAPETGIGSAAVRLALSAGGLAGASPGAALNVGLEVLPSAPVPIYVRVEQGALAQGVYSDLRLETVPCVEIAL